MKIQDLLLYWQIIRKRGWLPILLTAVTMGTIIGLSLMAEPAYVASVRFQVIAPPASEVSLFQAFGRVSLRDEIGYTRDNFVSVLTSLDLAWRVIEALDLNMNGRELVELIAVEPVEGSDFTEIKVSTHDPQLSADIANALITQGMIMYGEIRARGSTNSRKFIASQLEDIRTQLEQAQQELIAFKIENRIGDLDDVINSQQSLIRSLRLSKDQALAEGSIEIATNYEKIIGERALELQDLVQLGTQYSILQDKVNLLTQTYNFLLDKETEAQLKENEILNLGFIQPLSEARAPRQPEPALKLSILALGGVLSMVLGVVIVFLWEYVEQRNKLSTVETETGKPGEPLAALGSTSR